MNEAESNDLVTGLATISVGTPAEVQRDPAVVTAYFGTKRGASAAKAP